MRAVLAAVLLVTASGCGYDLPTQPPIERPAVVLDMSPAAINIISASRANGDVGLTLSVLNRSGEALANQVIDVSAVGGTISPASVTTPSTGSAQAVLIASGYATVTATSGGLTTSVKLLGASHVSPTAPLSVSVSGSTAQQVGYPAFFALNIPDGLWITSARWDFGDGAVQTGNLTTVSHAYSTAGAYTVEVLVTDAAGRTATDRTSIAVSSAPTYNPDPLSVSVACQNQSVQGTTTVPASCVVTAHYNGQAISSNINSVDWVWADGSTNSSAPPAMSHTYTVRGTYLVVATVHTGSYGTVVRSTTVTY